MTTYLSKNTKLEVFEIASTTEPDEDGNVHMTAMGTHGHLPTKLMATKTMRDLHEPTTGDIYAITEDNEHLVLPKELFLQLFAKPPQLEL